MPIVLTVDNLSKSFPGVKALDQLSFSLSAGEVHALCGENGAGKSTLIKCISGIWPADTFDGQIRLENEVAQFRNIRDSENAGIAVIYQELALVEEMTVAENVFLGREPGLGLFVNWQSMYQDCRNLLDQWGIHLNPNQRVKDLGIGQKQLVEIVKALAKNARILLLDEPTSALTDKEVVTLMHIIRKLKSRGIACLYISHKLEEVLDIADTITVIRDGRSIECKPRNEWTYGSIVSAMVGREVKDLFPRRQSRIGKCVLELKNITTEKLSDISLKVHAGEIVGIGGLMGAGRTELLMHLFNGAGKRCAGTVHLNSERYAGLTAIDSIREGLAMVPEDRKLFGLFLNESIAFNLSISNLNAFHSCGLIDGGKEMQQNLRFAESLKIKSPDLSVPVGGLSGGNQQKVVLGKSLMTSPEIILLDEPTRGIDVGAKVEVYQLMNQLTVNDKAVVLVSSEMPELIGMSDRIMILSNGRIAGEFRRGEATQEQLLQAAMKYS